MVVLSSRHSERSTRLLKRLIDNDSSGSKASQTALTWMRCEQLRVLDAGNRL